MSIFRIRWTFRDGEWRVASCRHSNEFATVAVQSIEHKRAGQRYLPVLSAFAPDEFLFAPTPYRCVQSYLDVLPEVEKCRRAQLLRLAAEVRAL